MQATFSFSAAAGLLWVATFPALLGPQRGRRAALDNLKTSPAVKMPPPGVDAADGTAREQVSQTPESGSPPPGADATSVRRKQAQAEAFSPDTALRVRPGVASRGYKVATSSPPADDLESCTPPGGSSGGGAGATPFAANGGSHMAKGTAARRPLQGRAQQAALLCWMHGAIGYGYFVMQARTLKQSSSLEKTAISSPACTAGANLAGPALI